MTPPTPVSNEAPDAASVQGMTAAKHQPLSQQIGAVVDSIKDQPIRLREIIAVLQGSSYLMLLILLAVPFCLPIPLLGLSTPFGVVIAIIGLRLALRKEPWLPERVLNVQMSAGLATKLLRTSQKSIRMLEKMLRPHWTGIVDPPFYQHFYGAIICVCGALMLLPLPIPFSNVLPALPVIMLAGALLERDGQFATAGVLMFIVNLCFFGAIFAGGGAVIGWLEAWFSGVYDPDEHMTPELEEILE